MEVFCIATSLKCLSAGRMDWRLGPDWKNNAITQVTWQSNQEQRKEELMKDLIGVAMWTRKRMLNVG